MANVYDALMAAANVVASRKKKEEEAAIAGAMSGISSPVKRTVTGSNNGAAGGAMLGVSQPYRQAYVDAVSTLKNRLSSPSVSPSPVLAMAPGTVPSATPEMMDAMRKRDPGKPILSQPAGMQITERRDPMAIYDKYVANPGLGLDGWDRSNMYDDMVAAGIPAQDAYALRQSDYDDLLKQKGDLDAARQQLLDLGVVQEDNDVIKRMAEHSTKMEKRTGQMAMDMIDQNPDFAEVAGGVDLAWPEDYSYMTGSGVDNAYAAIADPNKFLAKAERANILRSIPMMGQGPMVSTSMELPREYNIAMSMSDAEKDRYKYLYASDPVKATEYFYSLEPTTNQRRTQEMNQQLYEFGKGSTGGAIGATALSILAGPAKAKGYMKSFANMLTGQETDPYDPAFLASHASSSASGGARERTVNAFKDKNSQDTIWSKAAGFGYDLVQNLGSNALNYVLGTGGWGTLLMMGSQTAGDSAMDAALRTDGDTQKAFLYGTRSGLVEIATEKIPLDKLEDMLSGKSKGLRALLAQAFTEAPGEMASTAGQEAFDRIILGAQSNYETNVRKLMAGDPENGIAPMDEASARKEATGQFLDEVVYSGLLGFGSGVLSSGGAQMVGRILGNTPAAQQEVQKPAQEKTVKQKLDEAADAVIALREAEKPMPVEVEKTGDVLSFDQPMQAVRNTEEGGTSAPVQVAGIENGPDGKALLRVINESGTEERVGLDEVTLADEGMQDLLTDKAVQSMDAETLRGYLKDYNQDIATAPEYAKAYTGVYRRAATGMDYSTAVDGSEYAMRFLTAEAKRNAFEAGHAVSETRTEKAKPKTTGGVVRAFSDAAWKSMDRSTRRRAAAQMEVLNAIGQRFGRSIRVVDSINADGKRANGMYNQKTGEITVALDADNNAYAYVAMHELTHSIRTEHQGSWDTFSGVVRDALSASGQDADALVQYQMDRFGLDKDAAWEEVVCNTAPAMLQDEAVLTDLYNRDRTLFERVMEWVKNLIDDIRKAGVTLSERSQSWKQMDALKDDRESLQKLYDAMKGIFDGVALIEQSVVEGTRPSVMEAPIDASGNLIKYSLATYSEEMAKPFSVGRANAIGLEYEVQKMGARGKRTVVASGRDVTAALLKKEGHSQETIENVLRFGDKIADWFDKAVGKYQFVNLQDINDATIMIDHNTGAIVFSCQVPNSEYKVNFDFTTVCRQREAVQRFIDDLAREKGKNGTKLEDISLTPQNIFKLNTILKNEGYETACLGCFVEAKRYRIKAQMDVLCDEWNELVRAKNPNAEYFGFATGETDLMKMSDDEVTKLEASMRAYNTKGTSKATDRAARLVELPEMQKLLRPSDFISRHGRQKIREFSPALESFLVSRFGQSGAKPAVGFMPYNSEIAALPDTKSVKGKRMSLQDYLAGLGGARSNSFSDYIPTHALDYIQRTLDMAARRLPAQCYTKVPGRARTFGTTGEKINMSVMFDIDPDVHWSSAGLDTAGEYIVGDKVRAEKVQKETGERPFVQSFPYEEAVEIEHDPRYAENCGIIGVGYSYNHIVKMQSDENIPYIIPYHRSNMPDSVAKASNTKHATNYEPVQNNTRVTGYAVVTNLDEANGVPSYATWPEGKKKTKSSSLTWDMEAALKRNDGNAKATIMEWLEWMQENNLSPMTSTAEAGHGKYDLYAQLEATGDLDATAEGYMKYCLENGMLPVFYEFVLFDNYDKHLFDFSVRNLHTGKVALQKPVSLDFVEKDGAEVFIAQIESDMSEYNEYNRDQFFSEKWGRVKKAAYEELYEDELNTSEMFPTEAPGFKFSLREEDPPKKTIKGYKVFAVFKNKPGELYPPMVANPGGASTPVGVWLNADAAPRAEDSKTGRPKVQAGGKGTQASKQTLAYRPGWHLGDSPRASQFLRQNPETGKKELFPANFVWAECDVAADHDYQEEAMSYGYNPNGKWQHSLAGLPRLPREQDGTAGYYRYRTNPKPDTVPWIISGAIKVNRILDDEETRAILERQKEEFVNSEEYSALGTNEQEKALERFAYIPRLGGDIDLESFGLTAGDVDVDSKFSLSDYDENVQESDKLLEEMLTMTAAHRMTDGEAMRIASRAKKAAQSSMDTKELAGKIKRVFDYAERSGRNKKLDMPGFNAELLGLAEELLATSRTLDTEHEKAVQPVRDYLRKAEIALTDEQRQEAVRLAGTYNDFRRQVFGRVKLRQTGQSLSDVWGELSRMNPRMFPAGASEQEMVSDLVNAVDMMAPIYLDLSGMNEAEEVQRVAAEIGNLYMSLSGVQLAAAEYKDFGMKLRDYRQVNERFTAEHKKLFKRAMAKVTKASKAEIAQKTAEAKLSAEAQAAEDMEAYRKAMMLKNREWRETYRDKLKDTSRKQRYRAQITRMTNDLVKRLEKPTDKKHVKAYLEEDLMAFLSSLDLGRRSKVTRSLGDRIRTLADRFTEAQSNSESGSGQYMIDPELIEQMRTMADEMASLDSMDKLNADQMRAMRDMVKAATHVVNAADYMFAMEKKTETSEVAERSIIEMGWKKDKKVRQGFAGKIDDMLSNGMLDSFRFFDRLGESAREVFTGIRKGFDRKVEKVSDALDYVQRVTKGFGKDLFRGDKAQKTTYKVSGGEIALTKAQVMELYCLSKRPQAQKHLYGGGIRTQDNANAVTLNEADVQQICSSLTDEEVKMAEKLQSYLVKECAVWGNETSMLLYGYQKFTEENYYPIRVDQNTVQQMQTDKGQDENLYAILHMGMTKSTNDLANNALIVGDIFDTFSRHVDNMSTYNAYAAPIADMLRWYNWKPVDGGDGTKTMLEKKFGKAGRDYIPTLIRDLNGQVSKSYTPGIMEDMTRRAKSASVGANIRVAIQQPTAIARALDMMSPKYILKGMTMNPKAMKKAIDLAQKYCPIAKWKSLGFYETHIGKGLRTLMFGGQTVLDEVTDRSMALAGKMDEVTWGALWRACEAETRELLPDLNGAELYRETGKRLGEIIDYTQVVDTPLHRSQLMRSKNYGAQMTTAFMSEPTKTYNMLEAAISRWAENRKDPVARAKVGRVLLVYAGTAALNAAFQSVWDAVRDSGTEKDFLEKILGKYMQNLSDNLNPLGMIPIVSQVMDVLDGYDPSRMDMQAVQKVVQIGDQLKKVSEGKSNWTAAKWIQNVSSALSYMTGVPAGNLVRDLMAIYNTTSMALGGQPIAMTTTSTMTAETQKSLYGALVSGNAKKWNRMLESMKDKSAADIDASLAKQMAEEDERIALAYEAKAAGNGPEALRLRKEIVDELSGFSLLDEKRLTEIVDKAVLTYGASVNPEKEKEEEEVKPLSAKLFRTEDGKNAVLGVAEGRMSVADAKLILSELAADSTAQDPEKSVRSTVLAEVKKDWTAAMKAGDDQKARRLEHAMVEVLGVPEDDPQKWRMDMNADDLRTEVKTGDKAKASKTVQKMRDEGLSDSDIKARLSPFKAEYISMVDSGDRQGAENLKNMLIGLGLEGKNGKDLYTEETFEKWLDD